VQSRPTNLGAVLDGRFRPPVHAGEVNMFRQRTIKLVALTTFFLIALWGMLFVGMRNEFLAILRIEFNPDVGMKLLIALAILIWIEMLSVFSLVASMNWLIILARTYDNQDYLRLYRVMKFVLSSETRAVWDDEAKARGLT
jgi:hypothetical protein